MRIDCDCPSLERRVILEWVKDSTSVLDLGCGGGELLSILVRDKHVHAQGIEKDEQAIHRCVSKGLSVFQQDIDTGLSEYIDRSFDYVILSQTMQQVKKPGLVLEEAVRVGKKAIVSFPNFVYYSARLQLFLGGRVPMTPALPYAWYDTPNLHFLSITDFRDYCSERNIRVEDTAFVGRNRRIRLLPNLFAEIGIFLLSK